MRYVMECRVTNLFEKQGQRHVSGAGKDAVLEPVSLGWFITVDNKLSICVGDTKPGFAIGQTVQIIIQDKPSKMNAEPSPIAPAPLREAKVAL